MAVPNCMATQSVKKIAIATVRLYQTSEKHEICKCGRELRKRVPKTELRLHHDQQKGHMQKRVLN